MSLLQPPLLLSNFLFLLQPNTTVSERRLRGLRACRQLPHLEITVVFVLFVCSLAPLAVLHVAVWRHAAVEMREHRIVNLSDLLFCLAPEWEAANLKKMEEAYETVNMEIR